MSTALRCTCTLYTCVCAAPLLLKHQQLSGSYGTVFNLLLAGNAMHTLGQKGSTVLRQALHLHLQALKKLQVLQQEAARLQLQFSAVASETCVSRAVTSLSLLSVDK